MIKDHLLPYLFIGLFFLTPQIQAQQLKLPFDPEVAVADLYYGKAQQLSDSLKYDMSSRNYEEAAKKYEKAGEWEKFIKTNSLIAQNLYKQEKYPEALLHLEKILSLGLEKFPGKCDAIKEVYLLFGNIYIATGTYDKALESYKKALNVSPDVSKEGTYPKYRIYKSIADAYVYSGNCKEALNQYQKALDLQEKDLGKKAPENIDFYMNMGVAYALLGSYDQALFYYKKDLSFQLRSAKKNFPTIAKNYVNTGNLYQDLGFYDKTIDYYQKALDIQLKIFGDKHSETAVTYMNIGNVLARQGAYDKALNHYQKALSIQQAILGDENIEVARTYSNMGLTYEYLGQFEKAIGCFQKALPVQLKKFGQDHFEVARTYNNLGVAYEKWGSYDKAFFYDKKGLEIRLKTKHPDLPRSYVNTGVVLSALGNHEEALTHYLHAVDLWLKLFGEFHPEIAHCYLNIGRIYEKKGQYDKASVYIQKSLMSLAKDFKETNPLKNPSLNDISSKIILLEILGFKAYLLRSKYLKKSQNIQDLKASLKTYQLNVDLVDLMQSEYTEASDKQQLMKNSVGVYESGIKTALELYSLTKDRSHLIKAFEISERSKAFLLRETFRESEAKHTAGIPKSLVSKEKNLKIELAFLERKLFEAEQKKNTEKINEYRNKLFEKRRDLSVLVKKLEQEFPGYYRIKYDTRVTSVESVRKKLLDDKTALVEYFWGDSAVYVFTLTKKDLKLREIQHPEIVRQKVVDLRNIISESPGSLAAGEEYRGKFGNLSYDLYKALLGDSKKMPEITHLSIVPDGPLNLLPFEVLLTKPSSPNDSYAKLSYLLKQYGFSYTYSATLLEQSIEKGEKKNNGLCLALAPSYEKSSGAKAAVRGSLNILRDKTYVSLPGAQKEVSALASHRRGDFRFGKSASEADFKREAGNYSILHMAMHGETDEEHPMNSRLVFTPTSKGKEDGFLYAYELYNLQLNADLAVLSACRTGAGQYVRGEGVISLARAFMHAGVPSVVVTLWNTDDEASARLMADFYKSLGEKNSKDEALRQAKLMYLKNSGDRLSHPFYWAGFAAFGNMKPLPEGGSNTMLTWLIGGVLFFLIIVVTRNYRRRYIHTRKRRTLEHAV